MNLMCFVCTYVVLALALAFTGGLFYFTRSQP